jgi:hypothetical protein
MSDNTIMQPYKGKGFSGASTVMAFSSYASCRKGCSDSPSCLAYTFSKQDNLCKEYSRVDSIFRNGDVDGGVKRQAEK